MSWKDRFIDYCLDREWIRILWSILPSRCSIPGCAGETLRWMEHEVEYYSGPLKGKSLPICDACSHKLRQASFDAGCLVNHIDDDTVEYIPPSLQAERSKQPLEQ